MIAGNVVVEVGRYRVLEGAAIIERKLLIRGVSVGSYGVVYKQPRWGKWAGEQVSAKQIFLVRMII